MTWRKGCNQRFHKPLGTDRLIGTCSSSLFRIGCICRRWFVRRRWLTTNARRFGYWFIFDCSFFLLNCMTINIDLKWVPRLVCLQFHRICTNYLTSMCRFLCGFSKIYHSHNGFRKCVNISFVFFFFFNFIKKIKRIFGTSFITRYKFYCSSPLK